MQVTWEWRDFHNQGRKDGLQLKHWAKCLKDAAGNVKVAEEGDYRYSKYNKKVQLTHIARKTILPASPESCVVRHRADPSLHPTLTNSAQREA